MRCKAMYGNIEVIGDFCGVYESKEISSYIPFAGIIPSFFDESNDDPLFIQAVNNYAYYMNDMPKECKVNEKAFIMSYPGDPDLYPMIIFKRSKQDIFIVYKHGIVAGIFFQNGEKIVRSTRMD